MAEFKQNPDGSVSIIREQDSLEAEVVGGYAGAAGSNTPAFLGGATLAFNIAGPTDSAGGLLAWQNTKPYDIIVNLSWLDVLTVAGNACSASFGHSSASTGLAGHFISAKDVHTATGTFNSSSAGPVKIPQNDYITGSVSGTSSGLVARAYFTFVPAGAAASK